MNARFWFDAKGFVEAERYGHEPSYPARPHDLEFDTALNAEAMAAFRHHHDCFRKTANGFAIDGEPFVPNKPPAPKKPSFWQRIFGARK